ncbi:hypothetical protein [Streptomyces sp. CMB-StM0423]|uniref:hypothetical protein n=1 Tax=Streptomyces sp. CMB-StM0423 TaxID=2059884 RepID=UPI000C71474E|nr:hypothetical protein [Streptomyces sp. CMB-StM0423]AUH40508.1 hypothetical protein CXR04_09825 [Streptomyces sp. CMB-StM0423]
MPPTQPEPDRKEPSEVDFGVDQLDADEKVSRAFHVLVGLHAGSLLSLAEHHTADGRSYYVLFDSSATWGHPGEAPYVGVYLKRDPDSRTFDFNHDVLPLPAMVQSWLIHRGCPPDAITLDPGLGPQPADEATRALGRRLMFEGDHYGIGFSYTRDDPDDFVTVVAMGAVDEQAVPPFRVVVEEVDTDAQTYTLREGGFATPQEALGWCWDRLAGDAGPLPPMRPAAANPRPPGLPGSPARRPSGPSR